MPTLEITEAQASFLDALRDAIEDELVGPYGTVRRQDAMQYLIDNYGEPDELLADASETEVVPDDDSEEAADTEEETKEDQTADENDADDADDDGDSDGGGVPSPSGGGDAMLDEMMSLLEDNDDVWEQADSQETRYEVELPDGESETVQTKDDVRALLFKHYR